MGVVRRTVSRHAASLRRDRTEAEDRFWQAVRNRQLGGFKFRFQHSLYPYVADFACLEARLIGELDGGQHSAAVDEARTAALQDAGFEVVRFWNNEVSGNLEGVLTVVLATLVERVRDRPSPVSGEQHPMLFRSCRGHDRPATPLPQVGEG